MLGRRRQSIHGGFGPLSPQKSLGPFARNTGSSHGRAISPRASSQNLPESHNRLSSLVESPTTERHAEDEDNSKQSHEATNGLKNDGTHGEGAQEPSKSILNGTAEDIFDAPPSAGPPPPGREEPAKDADGFQIPAPRDDPISQAEREAAGDDADQLFRVNIKSEPIAEEDQDAKKAAFSNFANTLTQMGMPSRKAGTVRGRRDVRNTVYIPAPAVPELTPDQQVPRSPSLPATSTSPSPPKPSPAVATLFSEASHASDTQSVKSGLSAGGASLSGIARLRHPDLHGPNNGPGLHASIIETVSAVFEDGVIKSAKANGEIAFAYNADPDGNQPGEQRNRFCYVTIVLAATN